MAFSIRLTEEEKKLATSYAKLNSLSLGEAFKKYIDSGTKSSPFSELKKELELWYIP